MRTPRTWLALVAVLITTMSLLGGGVARADGRAVNFESYATGTVNGQDGWSSMGAAGSGCATYDHAIVDGVSSFAYDGFGDRALRLSNAVTSGCLGDQTFSGPTADEAGETHALGGGLSGGTRRTDFDASFLLASTVPAVEQAGLSMSVSPDRGDGARMSYLRFEDQSDGVHVFFDDYVDVAPFGSVGHETDGAGDGDGFRDEDIAILDRSEPHLIGLSMQLIDGARNDVVDISIDGAPVSTGTSWEDYYRWDPESGAGGASRTVDSLLFRTGGPCPGSCAPVNAGNGFLIDQVVERSFTPSSTTLVVNDVNPDAWTVVQHDTCGATATGSQQFRTGPGAPPAGSGSREFAVGSDGDSQERYGNTGLAGTKLADVTALSYATYVTQDGSGGQAVYATLRLDYGNDGVTDDRLFFEPVYQDGTSSGDPLPAQSSLTLNIWQTWDALHGGWWSENDGSGGPPLRTLQQVVADHPNARIVNDGGVGLRLAAGCGGAAWQGFIGAADTVTVGVNGADTTWDFEHQP
jgi:hypothetical protein